MKNQMIFQRYESKYLMTLSQQQTVLAAMEPYMEPDVYSHSSIRNLYLDTPDFRLIRRSLERPVYKEKLRIRSYGRAENTDMVFVELKKKYRSVVYKRRISLPQDQALACFSKTRPWPARSAQNWPMPRTFIRPCAPPCSSPMSGTLFTERKTRTFG